MPRLQQAARLLPDSNSAYRAPTEFEGYPRLAHLTVTRKNPVAVHMPIGCNDEKTGSVPKGKNRQ